VRPGTAIRNTPERRNVAGMTMRLEVAAVVVTVIVVEPLPVTEAGLKLHAASVGNPEHEDGVKLMVLLYPVKPRIVSFAVPLWPGLTVIGLKDAGN
jgi:hypothetical protein